jgi:hypothetical protein
MSMKLRQVAALALVGWTVMTPPMTCQDGIGCTPQYNPGAPLTEWYPGREFATESKCNEWLEEQRHVPRFEYANERRKKAERCISNEALRGARRARHAK